MEEKVKPLVEQEKAVRRDSESLSDKKSFISRLYIYKLERMRRTSVQCTKEVI